MRGFGARGEGAFCRRYTPTPFSVDGVRIQRDGICTPGLAARNGVTPRLSIAISTTPDVRFPFFPWVVIQAALLKFQRRLLRQRLASLAGMQGRLGEATAHIH